MQIFVRLARGNSVSLRLETDVTTDNLLETLFKLDGIPPCHQRLKFSGEILQPGRQLSEYRLPLGATVEQHLELLGGAEKEKMLEYDDDDDDPSTGDDSDSQDSEGEDTGLTENQIRLLYMLSLYTQRATNRDDKGEWIRKPAVLVLLYEGIMASVLDYDYAPMSECIDNRRVYLNITQEGKSDLEYLREEELTNGLQVSSSSYRPITCFQISDKGSEMVKRIGRKDKDAVHEFVYATGTVELLKPHWDGNDYWLESASNFRQKSDITSCEDVSYVSSAYVPQCLRYGGRPTLSNAHRAHESAASMDHIRDELDEVITLNSVSIIVAEYIPFGANQIVQLNHNVGSTERVQGGYISPFVDDDSTNTNMEMSAEMTAVDILDYTLTNHINFEAEITFQEDTGVVQVETFGVSLNAEGTCFYGMQVEAVMDRIKDNISLDHLSRLLVDVQQDSSSIVHSLISAYQRDLLQLIFLGDADFRNKVNLIIANEITPHLTAEEYMDKGEYENELKQVVGDTKAAYDISEHDTLIFGSNGLLVAGPNSRHHEPLLCAYLQFITIDIFMQNFFSRLWILNLDMKTTMDIIEKSGKEPTALKRIRARICVLADHVIQLEEILSYLLEALEVIEVPPEPPEQAGRSLYERLEISGMRSQLLRRATDLRKNVGGSSRKLDLLRELTMNVAEDKSFNISQSMEINSKRLIDLQDSNKETTIYLKILTYVLGGQLTFAILDRLTGDWTVVNTEWMMAFYENVIRVPLVWFIMSLFCWLGTAGLLYKCYKEFFEKARGVTTLRIVYERKIIYEKLANFLTLKTHLLYEDFCEPSENQPTNVVRTTYKEEGGKWGGSSPTITLEYDKLNQYLLTATIVYGRYKAFFGNSANTLSAKELKEAFEEQLFQAAIWNDKVEKAIHDNEALAIEKRRALEERAQEEDENGDYDDKD